MVGSEFGIKNRSMDPSCLVSMVQDDGGSVMVWGIYYLGPLVLIEHHLNATAYPSIVADHVHPFMNTVCPSCDGYFQQDNAPCHKSSQTGFLNMAAVALSKWMLHTGGG